MLRINIPWTQIFFIPIHYKFTLAVLFENSNRARRGSEKGCMCVLYCCGQTSSASGHVTKYSTLIGCRPNVTARLTKGAMFDFPSLHSHFVSEFQGSNLDLLVTVTE